MKYILIILTILLLLPTAKAGNYVDYSKEKDILAVVGDNLVIYILDKSDMKVTNRVKINAVTDKGNYFIDLLNARSAEGEVLPVKAVIKDVFMNAMGEYELLTEIGPGIYGRALIEERIKIKQYNITDERININQANLVKSVAEKKFKESPVVEKKKNDFFIWVVGGITFFLAILILYLLISGLL